MPASASAGLTPSVVTFPLTEPGQTSAAQTVTLTNNGGSPLTVEVFLSNDAGAFAVDQTNCPAQLMPAGSCGLIVSFKPTATGYFYSEMSIPGTGYYMGLVGNTPVPTGTITPSGDQDFGFAEPGDPKTKHFTVESTGIMPLPIAEVNVFGMSDTDFTVLGSSDCIGDLAPGATCEFDVRFDPKPGFSASREALLTVRDAEENTLLLVHLTGNTTVPDYTLTPTKFKGFGEAVIGTGLTRTPATFTITSTGDGPLPYEGFEFVGPDAGSFPVEHNCPSSIPVDQSCSIQVRFDPTNGIAGPRQVGFVIKAGVNANAYTGFLLKGTAVGAPLIPSPLPPTGQANLSLKLRSAKKARRGKTLVLRATVTNTGDATATSIVLRPKVPAKLAKKSKPVKISGLAPGKSAIRKIRIRVKKAARKGKKLKLMVSANATGLSAKTARRVVKIG